jgi:glycosyltransferase involved in cell wall biosynthesis
MAGTTRQIPVGLTGAQLFSKLVRKIVLLIGEDSFAAADRGPLLAVLGELAREIVVIASAPQGVNDREIPGVRVIDFDCRASLSNPAHDALTAWRLARILEAEDADVLHFIGVGPVALGSLALKLQPGRNVIVHLPDLGLIDAAEGGLSRFYRPSPAGLVAALTRRPSSFLLTGTPEDLAYLRTRGVDPGARFAILGGMGVDPDAYPVMPPSQSGMPVAACPGRMVRSSGIDLLMRVFDRLWARGLRLQLELVGAHTTGSDAVSPAQLAQWSLHPSVRRTEPAADLREVWRHAEICVLPAVGRQGLPRILLEAAACGRALIVTEFAGGGSFVRDEVEGLVVPCGDGAALAGALERVARNAELRTRMGEAARLRVLHGFTEAHVRQTLRNAYLALLGAPGSV